MMYGVLSDLFCPLPMERRTNHSRERVLISPMRTYFYEALCLAGSISKFPKLRLLYKYHNIVLRYLTKMRTLPCLSYSFHSHDDATFRFSKTIIFLYTRTLTCQYQYFDNTDSDTREVGHGFQPYIHTVMRAFTPAHTHARTQTYIHTGTYMHISPPLSCSTSLRTIVFDLV